MDDPNAPKAVAAAAGVHIVLPGYFTPDNMGFANLRTSRGATMYFLPWLGHTVVGSTDKKCDRRPSPLAAPSPLITLATLRSLTT
jgi:glycerol-3-phosphate dehydrogenase